GTPPMLGACQDYGKNSIAILGFRGKENVILKEKFETACEKVYVTTNDGSFGTKGFVTDVLKPLLEEDNSAVVYACGPMPMLKGIFGRMLCFVRAKNGLWSWRLPCMCLQNERK
ncbi:MAG: hypothetical protein RRZ68_01425, partial [Oscillospiraceae bacterium]